ncbi:hypothetical protein ESA94_03585 [Lacibacter luteus]|uniref:Uncharacterized protein n=1 Tax=Lacibacter luteus TaxID=2508719 RepID=A0A4Q1CM35_9BACT|nr:hypothetical protein [Lacibacter luteus]RXK62107.1 hypothetical protein ESA94_03585 [Lacibacter luteus]
MKKLICLLVCIATSHLLLAQAGRIRVSFAGFDCIRETWDDILHADGKGDEVYFTFSFLLGDKNGTTKLNYEKRTPVYGDATGQFSNRISVGSWVDVFGNNRGGIKAGDNYRGNLLLGEYDVANDDILTIVPTAWEQDPIADNQAGFSSTIQSMAYSINQKIAPVVLGIGILTMNPTSIIFGAGQLGIPKIKAGGEQGELGKPGTRPIGMEKYGDFSPKFVGLKSSDLAFLSNSDMGYGKGVIPVHYDETAVGNLRDHGIYTVLLKVEFFPSQTQSTTTTQPSNTGNGTTTTTTVTKTTAPSTIKTVNTGTTTSTSTVAGIWKGTYGTGSSNNTTFYSFQLNPDGTMNVLDASGKSIAAGTYNLNNNQLTGIYRYTGNNNAFSFAASVKGSQMEGTWGSGSNVSGGGRWMMTKAATGATTNIR